MAEEWEIVKIVGTEEEATIVVGFLQSSGIESELESLRASEFPTDIGDLANVNIRVPSDTHTPVVMVQLPLGLNLPGGAKLQVDDGKTTDLQIQTCENRGCYAGTPISPELLAALRSGKQLKVLFQNLAKETITIPMPLTDFAAAYDKIK